MSNQSKNGSHKKKKTSTKSTSTKKSSSSTSKNPAQKSKGVKARKILLGIGIALMVLLIVGIIAFATYGIVKIAHGEFYGMRTTYVVTIDGKTYTKDTAGLIIRSDTEIEIESLKTKGDGEYSVKITATAAALKFDFKVGQETYKWTDVDGWDFTVGFTLKATENGFSLSYGSLADLIAEVMGRKVTLEQDSPIGDMFIMTISDGDKEMHIGFGLTFPVGGVELNPDHIIG